MKVLVVGHGAREHAIAKKLAQEDLEIVAAMSRLNPGIAALSERVEVFDIDDPSEYGRFKGVDLAFVGPEAPLATGVSDTLWELGVPVVGPRKALAKLEHLAVVHVRCSELAQGVARALAEKLGFPLEDILLTETGPLLSTHGGPHVIGVITVTQAP